MVNAKINKLMGYAGKNCPYYERLFSQNSIDVNKIEDFYKIPVLTKELIQQNEIDIISKEYNIDDLIVEKTSGSTGCPLYCRYDKEERVRRSMFLWIERKRNSPQIIGKRMVNFHSGGRVQGTKVRGQDIELDEKHNVLYLNYLNMDGSKIIEYYEAMEKFNPFFIRCQPSIISEFISFCNKNNLDLQKLGVGYIELVGEYLHQHVYEDIKKAFPNTFVANQYGAQEFFCVAYSCRENKLHILKDAVFVEILNKDEEGYGDIVITSLNNYSMPLIRYRIGDIGRIDYDICSCGKTQPILELKSARKSELFELNGQRVHADIFKNCIEKFNVSKTEIYIKQYQVFQTSNDIFIIKIISDKSEFLNEFQQFINSSIRQKIDQNINIKVETADRLTINPITGKLKTYNFLR